MQGDDRKKRAASVHGVTFKPPRQQTSPGTPLGIPPAPVLDEIDDAPTPPPQNVEEAITWFHLVERFGKIELGFSAFQQSFPRLEGLVTEFVIPALKDLMARIDGLLSRQETNSARLELFFDEQWPALQNSVADLVTRLSHVERLAATIEQHNDRIARTEKALDTIALRVDKVERRLDDAELSKRVVLAERKRWWSFVVNTRNAVTAVVALVTAVVVRWGDVVDFLSSLGR